MYNCNYSVFFWFLLKQIKRCLLGKYFPGTLSDFFVMSVYQMYHPLTPTANIHFTLYHQHPPEDTANRGPEAKTQFNVQWIFKRSVNRFIVHGHILWNCEVWKILTLQFCKICRKYTRNMLIYIQFEQFSKFIFCFMTAVYTEQSAEWPELVRDTGQSEATIAS